MMAYYVYSQTDNDFDSAYRSYFSRDKLVLKHTLVISCSFHYTKLN